MSGDKHFDGTARPPRFGLMTLVVEKRDGAWQIVVAQNTNALLGTPPELQDIKTPIAIPDHPVDAIRVNRDRRDGVCRDAGSSRRVVVSDHLRESGESGGHRHDESAVFGMDHDVPERQVVQGYVGSIN
ncbi:MAG TPA: hypothetical protein VEW05_07560 [Candidatus Polarisedimenticolia bacterium]|nr:hypothetical protein [Candidatus Polarisedimenticolia bacterium]